MPSHAAISAAGVAPGKLAALGAREEKAFLDRIPKSLALYERAKGHMPGGVAQSWFYTIYRRVPVFVSHGEGPWFEDIDANRYIDFNLADLSFTQGWGETEVARRVIDQARRGAHFLLPTEDSVVVAELLAERTGVPFWQFTVSASTANVEAIRIARHATGREKIVVFDGKYHGHIEDTMVDPGTGVRRSVASHLEFTRETGRNTIVVPFNDVPALEAALAPGDVACVLTEPALTNMTLVLPDAGFHARLRKLTRAHGTLLVLDEAHTVQMAYGGLVREWGLDPDIVTCGKGFGSGHPIGAYGMTEPLARLLERDMDLHVGFNPGIALGGTLFGTALGFAAMRATLETVLTEAGYARTARLGARLADGIDHAIARYGLPWRAQRLNARCGITLGREHPRNGAEGYRSMDIALIDTRRVYMANRGVWEAISSAGPQPGFAHVEAEVDRYAELLDGFLGEIVDA